MCIYIEAFDDNILICFINTVTDINCVIWKSDESQSITSSISLKLYIYDIIILSDVVAFNFLTLYKISHCSLLHDCGEQCTI